MKTILTTLVLGTSLFSMAASALSFPEIKPGQQIIYKGKTQCDGSGSGRMKKTTTISHVYEDGSFDWKSKDNGFNGFGLWSLKSDGFESAAQRAIKVNLLEGTNCQKISGTIVDIEIKNEIVTTCLYKVERENNFDRYYFAAGYELPVRIETSVKMRKPCDEWGSSVTII